MQMMLSLNGLMLVVTILCCNSQVHCTSPEILSKYYNFKDEQLVIGKNHIDKTILVYAICKIPSNEQTAKCKVIHKRDVYDDTKSLEPCELDLSTESSNGKLDILGVDLWREDKALFAWFELDQSNLKSARFMIQTLNMLNCSSQVHKWTIDIRDDMIPQIFIIPSENTYDVVFPYRIGCRKNFCKVTIDACGGVSDVVSWFRNRKLTYALEPIANISKKLLIIAEDTLPDYGKATYYLLDGNEKMKLGITDHVENFGWSTANGFLSFCSIDTCTQISYAGASMRSITLNMARKPSEYAALYNLPNKEILAFICDKEPNSYYRIIKIGVNGLEYSFDLDQLKCSEKPDDMTSKFFKKNDTEYCLSLFYSVVKAKGKGKFSTYCLPFEG